MKEEIVQKIIRHLERANSLLKEHGSDNVEFNEASNNIEDIIRDLMVYGEPHE